MPCTFELPPAEYEHLFLRDVLAGQMPQRYAAPPEIRLMLAVLEQAWDEAHETRVGGQAWQTDWRLLRIQARDWFAIRGSAHPFSFENIAEVLKLDAGRIRAKLARGGSDEKAT